MLVSKSSVKSIHIVYIDSIFIAFTISNKINYIILLVQIVFTSRFRSAPSKVNNIQNYHILFFSIIQIDHSQ